MESAAWVERRRYVRGIRSGSVYVVMYREYRSMPIHSAKKMARVECDDGVGENCRDTEKVKL